jgi:SAM-dependent methyltransferase
MRDLPFVHPLDHTPLVRESDAYVSKETGDRFAFVHGVPCFVDVDLQQHMKEERSGIENAMKTFLRKRPGLYVFLIYLISPVCFVRISAKRFLKRFPVDALVLNVGAGVHRYSQNMINIDIFPYEGIDVVADAGALPFADRSVDAVICENLIEHLPHAQQVVDDMFRVLKPGGQLYLSTPFVYPFHASPNDFQRWSTTGLRHLCKAGHPEVVAPRSGPTSALIAQFVTWLAIVLSFGSTALYNLWSMLLLIPTFPFKILDLVIGYYPTAMHGPATVYGIFTKK